MTQIGALTPDAMVSAFESLVDDSLDEVTEYQLLNDVKDTLEADDEWAMLKQCDTSQIAGPNDTYLTFHTLPANFGLPAQNGIFVGNDIVPYIQVPFEQRMRWMNISHRYYIDMANNQYALCGGTNPGGVIQFFYQAASPVLVSGGAPWIFPPRFHMILPQLMAEMFPAIDQPDKSRAWDDRWNTYSGKRLEIMRRWNMRLQLQGHQNDGMPIDITADPNIIDIDSSGISGTIYG